MSSRRHRGPAVKDYHRATTRSARNRLQEPLGGVVGIVGGGEVREALGASKIIDSRSESISLNFNREVVCVDPTEPANEIRRNVTEAF